MPFLHHQEITQSWLTGMAYLSCILADKRVIDLIGFREIAINCFFFKETHPAFFQHIKRTQVCWNSSSNKAEGVPDNT